MVRYKDYDAAAEELEPEAFEFTIGGKEFTAPIDLDAKEMLQFLRLTASQDSSEVARGMRALLGDKVWVYIYSKTLLVEDGEGSAEFEDRPAINWYALRALINDLAIYYGGGIVGIPKAVVDAQQVVNPPTEEETSTTGSDEQSGSSTDGESSSEEELVSTDSV